MKMSTVHAVLANAATQDWEIEHVNVKSTYLNAQLKEEIYMRAPRGVLLKQAGRGWYSEMMRVFTKEMGFK